MNPRIEHTDVGAYALGLLEEPDRKAFEAHLARCSACAAELAEFRGMRELFSGLDATDLVTPDGPTAADGVPPTLAPAGSESGSRSRSGSGSGSGFASGFASEPPDRTADLMRRRRAADRARERRHRRSSTLLAAAAAVGLLAGGIGVASAVLDNDSGRPGPAPAPVAAASASDLLRQGERRTAVDQTSGATGTVAMEGKAWGTRVALDLGNVRGELTCQLIAVSKAGGERVVAGWSVPARGYGVPGQPVHLVIEGAVATQRADLSGFKVRTDDGHNLLTIPV